MDAAGQILGHSTRIDRVDARLFQQFGESRQFGIVVQLGSVFQTAGPGEDRCDRVGRRRFTLLVLSEEKIELDRTFPDINQPPHIYPHGILSFMLLVGQFFFLLHFDKKSIFCLNLRSKFQYS